MKNAVFALILLAVPWARASTVWTGPAITYSQPAPDPTQASNQDRITARVWLTRGATEGLFNAVDESSYDKPTDSDPTDTEWSFGALSNYLSLHYTTWAAMSGNDPPNMVGVPAVVHLKTDDIYIAITFTFWGIMGPGFAYTRSTAPVAAVPPTVSIVSPTNGATFAAPADVAISASATNNGGTPITNVQFFANGTLLGALKLPPFQFNAANLAAKTYALVAVAIDNNSLSATSAPVDISVVVPVPISNYFPRVTSSQFVFDHTANPGLSYVAQSSRDLVNWTSFVTNAAVSNSVEVQDVLQPGGNRFYRVRLQPNP